MTWQQGAFCWREEQGKVNKTPAFWMRGGFPSSPVCFGGRWSDVEAALTHRTRPKVNLWKSLLVGYWSIQNLRRIAHYLAYRANSKGWRWILWGSLRRGNLAVGGDHKQDIYLLLTWQEQWYLRWWGSDKNLGRGRSEIGDTPTATIRKMF